MPVKMKTPAQLSRSHESGAHDLQLIDGCPRCQDAAAESARLIRESGRSRKRGPKQQSDEEVQMVKDWRNGVTIAQLRSRTGLKRSQIRKILEDGVGGKAEFKKLRTVGSGGTRKSARQTRSLDSTLPPDSFVVPDFGVPRITSCRKEDGWGYTRIKTGYDKDGHSIFTDIHIHPDGTNYIEAHSNEHADLVRDFPEGSAAFGLPSMRLKNLGYSAISRIAAEVESRAEEMKEASERKIQIRREKRDRRKAGAK